MFDEVDVVEAWTGEMVGGREWSGVDRWKRGRAGEDICRPWKALRSESSIALAK